MFPLAHCTEKNELEARIRNCVRLISRLSNQAGVLARSSHSEAAAQFQLKKLEIHAQNMRLRTLRECLDIHQSAHGCQ